VNSGYANHRAGDSSLLLSAAEAARLLGLSRKTLWNHTAPRGDGIPAIHIGRVVRYSRSTLERWIAERECGKAE